MTRFAVGVLLIGIAFATLTAASTTRTQTPQVPSSAGAAQDPFPEGTGKAALLKVCSNCHTAQSVIQTFRTRLEWSDVVDQMSRFGAEGSDQEFEQILAYLAKHFSPIRINTAPARDLQAALDVSADVAAAIVAYRTDKGDFKTIEDVKNVPGLEGNKVDSLKTRIVF